MGNTASANVKDPDFLLRRRKFLKGVGGSVLALGATGLLAGCNFDSGSHGGDDCCDYGDERLSPTRQAERKR
jgi:hypothetical protein